MNSTAAVATAAAVGTAEQSSPNEEDDERGSMSGGGDNNGGDSNSSTDEPAASSSSPAPPSSCSQSTSHARKRLRTDAHASASSQDGGGGENGPGATTTTTTAAAAAHRNAAGMGGGAAAGINMASSATTAVGGRRDDESQPASIAVAELEGRMEWIVAELESRLERTERNVSAIGGKVDRLEEVRRSEEEAASIEAAAAASAIAYLEGRLGRTERDLADKANELEESRRREGAARVEAVRAEAEAEAASAAAAAAVRSMETDFAAELAELGRTKDTEAEAVRVELAKVKAEAADAAAAAAGAAEITKERLGRLEDELQETSAAAAVVARSRERLVDRMETDFAAKLAELGRTKDMEAEAARVELARVKAEAADSAAAAADAAEISKERLGRLEDELQEARLEGLERGKAAAASAASAAAAASARIKEEQSRKRLEEALAERQTSFDETMKLERIRHEEAIRTLQRLHNEQITSATRESEETVSALRTMVAALEDFPLRAKEEGGAASTSAQGWESLETIGPERETTGPLTSKGRSNRNLSIPPPTKGQSKVMNLVVAAPPRRVASYRSLELTAPADSGKKARASAAAVTASGAKEKAPTSGSIAAEALALAHAHEPMSDGADNSNDRALQREHEEHAVPAARESEGTASALRTRVAAPEESLLRAQEGAGEASARPNEQTIGPEEEMFGSAPTSSAVGERDRQAQRAVVSCREERKGAARGLMDGDFVYFQGNHDDDEGEPVWLGRVVSNTTNEEFAGKAVWENDGSCGKWTMLDGVQIHSGDVAITVQWYSKSERSRAGEHLYVKCSDEGARVQSHTALLSGKLAVTQRSGPPELRCSSRLSAAADRGICDRVWALNCAGDFDEAVAKRDV